MGLGKMYHTNETDSRFGGVAPGPVSYGWRCCVGRISRVGGIRNGETAACCNNEMRVGQKSRLAGWELLLFSERAILTSDAPSWVAICHAGDVVLSHGCCVVTRVMRRGPVCDIAWRSVRGYVAVHAI